MRQAKVLRLLRYDAKSWWYFKTLREQGRIDEARKLERQSILSNIRFIRENINREAITYRVDTIWFKDKGNGVSYTTSLSNVHPGMFATWVYCYANRIGEK